MAATTHVNDQDDDQETTSRKSRGSRKSSRSAGAGAGLSTAAVLDIVERLGLVDLIVDRMKTRLEDIDIDDLIDEVADYLRRNPEVLVVTLGAVTIAAGALVYLNRRNEGGSRSERSTSSASTKSPGTSGSSRRTR